MHERWVEMVHDSYTCANIAKDLEHLLFSQSVAETGVHETNDSTTRTILHEDENFVASTL